VNGAGDSDSDPPAAKVYQETAYGFSGVAGESRSGDANGQEFRVLGGGGSNTIAPFTTPDLSGQVTGIAPFAFLGSQPAKQSSAKTPFRPDVPCETQDPPDLHAGALGPAPATSSSGRSPTYMPPDLKALVTRYGEILKKASDAKQLQGAGSRNAAQQLLEQAGTLFAGWSKDWAAFQKSNGVTPTIVPNPVSGGKR
jgi:hypothetical protein